MQMRVHQRAKQGQKALARVIEEVRFPLELGRQARDTEPMFEPAWLESEQRWRMVVAPGSESTVGRHHAFLELLPGGLTLRIANISTRSRLQLGDGTFVLKDAPCERSLSAGGIDLVLSDSVAVRLQTGVEETPALGELPHDLSLQGTLRGSWKGAPFSLPSVTGIASTALKEWIRKVLEVVQNPDFFQRAVQAVVAMADMDSGRVLLREKGAWKTEPEAVALSPGAEELVPDRQPSQRILNKVLLEKKTVWVLPAQAQNESLLNVRAVVAAPILDARGEVVGVLYGDRRQELERPIKEVEAMLVQLLAYGIAAGLARLEQERTTLRFEQFFTPQLARHLAENPEMLQGRIEQVTLLFCDVRGFSRISEKLGAEKTVSWISDIMAELSECVIDHQGVLVDYIGDELLAMWGAPEPQADHAQLACRAALAMLEKLPALNAQWEAILGEPIAFGIGLNSGEAQVGNTGSPRKFKYGALGNTVNLASRVQGATKHLQTHLLITEATYRLLDETLRDRARRLGTVQVINIKNPVTLYELATPRQAGWPDWKDVYEQALVKFEEKDFRGAARLLPTLVSDPCNDGPSIVLLFRAVQGMKDGAAEKHPVWELPAK
jgi:adenylate cyclase